MNACQAIKSKNDQKLTSLILSYLPKYIMSLNIPVLQSSGFKLRSVNQKQRLQSYNLETFRVR